MRFFTPIFVCCFSFCSIFIFNPNVLAQNEVNPTNRQVVLQVFWWDFRNNNFFNDWSNYLVELAPRLKEMGIDAVWIPPNVKGASLGVGYNPFDHYDLGDKYQKGTTFNRVGDKDELLRLIAVLKANGIDVIQDVVLNHVTGAGSRTGKGGQDPEAMEDGETDKFKNFRYVCFETPESDFTAENYLARVGRFPKNWQNFYPNNDNECCSNDLNSPWWGPDVSYEENAFGQSSNATFNPEQSPNYMRDQMREWMIWYKQQMGFDGYRLDAVKHFPPSLTEDVLWNIQNNAGFASEGEELFAVGEYVGGGADLDNWANAVQNRAGTFDFGLRGELYGMVYGMGGYNMGNLPNGQQSNRFRTVPFINNHDTFRPQLDNTGNYDGWNTGSELAPHIEPNEARLSAAYAFIFAADGAPQVFFEDLFDIGYDGNRFLHEPTDATELPVRDDLFNLIWCRQHLRFTEGEYLVRWQADDLLIIERSARALVCMNDSWDQWQDPIGVQTSFPDGTVLKDYSGAAGTAERTVYGGGKVDLAVPPCNGSANAGRRGYSVWAPVGISSNYERPAQFTEQQWEMSDDLGDSFHLSLQQGGALPPYTTECRQAGKIYSNDTDTISIKVFPTDSTQQLVVQLLDDNCMPLDSLIGFGEMELLYVPQTAGWKSITIRNADTTNVGQSGLKIRAKYKAPKVVDTSVYKEKCSCLPQPIPPNGINMLFNQKDFVVSPNPSTGIFRLDNQTSTSLSSIRVYNTIGESVLSVSPDSPIINLSAFPDGIYFLHLSGKEGNIIKKLIKH